MANTCLWGLPARTALNKAEVPQFQVTCRGLWNAGIDGDQPTAVNGSMLARPEWWRVIALPDLVFQGVQRHSLCVPPWASPLLLAGRQ